MYEDIKWIANQYRIKCNKYAKEELTPELCDRLFDEVFNEYTLIQSINRALAEGAGGAKE